MIGNEQSNHHNIPGEKDVLRVTARKLAYDVTCDEVLGDNATNPPCLDSPENLDKYKPSFVCIGSVSTLIPPSGPLLNCLSYATRLRISADEY